MSMSNQRTTVTTVSAEGEVVVPSSLGAAKKWEPGTEVEIVDQGDGFVLRRKQPLKNVRPRLTWDEFLARIPKYEGPYITDEMMHEAIEIEARRRWNAEDRR